VYVPYEDDEWSTTLYRAVWIAATFGSAYIYNAVDVRRIECTTTGRMKKRIRREKERERERERERRNEKRWHRHVCVCVRVCTCVCIMYLYDYYYIIDKRTAHIVFWRTRSESEKRSMTTTSWDNVGRAGEISVNKKPDSNDSRRTNALIIIVHYRARTVRGTVLWPGARVNSAECDHV
jgi:hypothetical protein